MHSPNQIWVKNIFCWEKFFDVTCYEKSMLNFKVSWLRIISEAWFSEISPIDLWITRPQLFTDKLFLQRYYKEILIINTDKYSLFRHKFYSWKSRKSYFIFFFLNVKVILKLSFSYISLKDDIKFTSQFVVFLFIY